MPRIRSLKPETWTDPKLVGCGAYARLLYLGLAGAADDHGVAADEPARLKLQILPADPVDVAALLDELVGAGKLTRALTPAGRPVLVLVDWDDEQRIDKPSAPRHAPRDQLTPANPREDSRALAKPDEPSRAVAVEGKGSGKGEERAASQLGRSAAQPDSQLQQREQGHRGGAVVLDLRPTTRSAQDAAEGVQKPGDGAQGLVAWWLAAHREHGQHRPPKRVVGHVAREVAQLLTEDLPADAIRAGLDTLRTGGLHPSALAALVNQHRNAGTGWTAARARAPEPGGGSAGYVRADLAAFNAALTGHSKAHGGPTVREVSLR